MADGLTTPIADATKLGSKDLGAAGHAPFQVLVDQAGADAMGLVDASPAANSLLGRLKAIADAITTMDGHVDGLEGLATTLNGLVDGLETLIGTTNTNLSSISGYVDGLEALHTTLNGYVDGLEALAAAATPAGTNIIGRVGIDQTTDGTTNKINIDASLKSGTATRSTVNSGTSSVTILASNANRKGATIYNSDANALLLDLSGGTASATRHQVKLAQYQSHEIGNGNTGAITGIWEADGSGLADVVENT